jgi:elongation factor G
LRVLDGGVVVLDGKKGVEAQTETVWRQAKKYKIPRLIFVNKMDSIDGVEKFDNCIKSLIDKFGADPLVLQFPIGSGKDLKGVVDIIEQKAHYFEFGLKDGGYKTENIPSDLVEKAKRYKEELIEKIIVHDEELFLKYLDGDKELDKEQIKRLVRKATLTANQFPVYCGSAYKYVGVELLLDGIVEFLPSPFDTKELTVFSQKTGVEEKIANSEVNSPCLALAFKITVEGKYNSKLTFFRVYAGVLRANSYIYNITKGVKERVSRLVRMSGGVQEKVDEVYAGDIAAAMGLEKTITGDTFGDEKNNYVLENIDFAEPVISQAIEPKTNADRDKLKDALDKLRIQDPSFKY